MDGLENRRSFARFGRIDVGSTEASNAGFTSSYRKPTFCSVVETLGYPIIIIIHRLAAAVKKPVGVGFLR
jgi:hypothetical protein